jgi:uncharacterized linocin/CFP29 family protein
LDDSIKPASAHNALTTIVENGKEIKILRDNMPLPADVRQYPDAIAQALSQLRLVGVNGPYTVLLGTEAYTSLAETSDHGYPALEHVKRLVDDKIIWAPL